MKKHFYKIYLKYEYADNIEKSADISKSTDQTQEVDVTTITQQQVDSITEYVQKQQIKVVNKVINKHSVNAHSENIIEFKNRLWKNVNAIINIDQTNVACVVINSSFTGDLSSELNLISTKSFYDKITSVMNSEKKEKLNVKYQSDPDAQKSAVDNNKSNETSATTETKTSEKKDKFTNTYCDCNKKDFMFLKEDAKNTVTTTTEETKNEVTTKNIQYQYIYNKISTLVEQSSYTTVINECVTKTTNYNKIEIDGLEISPLEDSEVTTSEISNMQKIKGTEVYDQSNVLSMISSCAADTKITTNILSNIMTEFNISVSNSVTTTNEGKTEKKEQKTEQKVDNKEKKNNNQNQENNNNNKKENKDESILTKYKKEIIIVIIFAIILFLIIMYNNKKNNSNIYYYGR